MEEVAQTNGKKIDLVLDGYKFNWKVGNLVEIITMVNNDFVRKYEYWNMVYDNRKLLQDERTSEMD